VRSKIVPREIAPREVPPGTTRTRAGMTTLGTMISILLGAFTFHYGEGLSYFS
jgi:hypothetical protein